MNDSVPIQAPQPKNVLPGPKILLFGPPGSGKTHSIHSLVDAGLEVFAIFTEPGMEVVADIPSDKLHWHYIPPAAENFESLAQAANDIQTKDPKTLAAMAFDRRAYGQWVTMLKVLGNFLDQRTGKNYGSVNGFTNNQVLFCDSLSGWNAMAMNLVCGNAPIKSQQQWGMAIEQEEKLVTQLTTGLPCWFVLTAHPDREIDATLGGSRLMPGGLGSKFPSRIGRFFSDVIYTERTPKGWQWSTAKADFDGKARNLPWADGLAPSFAPIVANWNKKGQVR